MQTWFGSMATYMSCIDRPWTSRANRRLKRSSMRDGGRSGSRSTCSIQSFGAFGHRDDRSSSSILNTIIQYQFLDSIANFDRQRVTESVTLECEKCGILICAHSKRPKRLNLFLLPSRLKFLYFCAQMMKKSKARLNGVPTWIPMWLACSSILVLYDAGYVLLRPRTLPGGDLSHLWQPYVLYAKARPFIILN